MNTWGRRDEDTRPIQVGASLPGETHAARAWRWFWAVWRGETAALVAMLAGSAATAALHAAFAMSWKLVIDAARAGDPLRAGLLCVALGVAQAVFYIVVQGARTIVNERIQRRVRRRLLEHLVDLDARALRGYRTGDLVTRLTDDVGNDKLSWWLCSGVLRAAEAAMICAAAVAGMIYVDPVLSAWSLAPLPALAVLQAWMSAEIAARAGAVQAAVSATNAVAQESLDGVRVLQARGLTALARRAYAEATARLAEAEVANARRAQAQFTVFGYGWQVALAVLLGVGGARVLSGATGVGDFVAFNGFVASLVFPMFDLGAFVVRGAQASASLARLDELLAVRPTADAGAFAGRVALEGFALDIGGPLAVAPGTLTAVTGPVGSGKSTLIQALAGVFGHEVADGSAWVPQDPLVLSITVRENVSLGAGVDVDAAVDAAKLASDVAAWPGGLDTAVGDRGLTLSGGQQQRVQIARAYASAPRVLLLDDATSALDAETELRLLDTLLSGDRAVVLVTHRVATLSRADEVIYLQRGEVAVRGTHASLVASCPRYAAAYG